MKFALVSLLALLLLCARAEASDGAHQTSCHIGGIAEPVECLDFEVPLDWQRPDGESITLHAVVVPALSGRPEPDPLIVLAGGPGQAASDYGPLVERAFAAVRRSRDVVLLDQRGTGGSAALPCAMDMPAFAAFDLDAMAGGVADCARDASVDPRFLTSAEVVQDIEHLRRLLGAERVNLWGGSFGTRLAEHYVRKYPERARAVVLDAAIPAAAALFATAPRSAQASWEALVAACEADAPCAARFGGLDRRLAALTARLEQAPDTTTLTDPTTGRTLTTRVDRALVTETMRGALYLPTQAALLPYAVTRAGEGDYAPLAALAHATAGWAGETMYLGATLSILCSEEVPRLDATGAEQAADGAFVRDTYFRLWRSACDAWPSRELDETWFRPLQSNVPALILSGAQDPVTPPALGEAAARGFAPAVHAIAPHGGHTISALGCAPDLIAEFLSRPRESVLDTTCLETSIDPVPFALGPLGPLNTEDAT